MKKTRLNINKLNRIIFVGISILLLIIGLLSFILFNNSIKLNHLENGRYKLYALGIELKESSEKLTKYCRSYVLTGDSIWEYKYWELLDIRNGNKPRPNGRTIALKDSLIKLGISKSELEKLSLAEKKSNLLVWTEKVAFNAMKGLYADSAKQFVYKSKPDTLFAQRIMFDEKYHSDKEQIIKPIMEFREMLDNRINSESENKHYLNDLLLFSVSTLILITLLFSFYAIIVLKKRLITQNKEIIKLNDDQKEINKELLALNATKDKLFSIIAHDLRAPFNSLVGFSDLLIEKTSQSTDKELHQYSSIINESLNKTYNYLNNLLEWSRLQTNKIEFSPSSFGLLDLVHEVQEILIAQTQNKKIEIKIAIPKKTQLLADRNMIKIVLINLVSNAIKFSNEYSKIIISSNRIKNQDKIIIEDFGVGMSKDSYEKLFEIEESFSTPGTNNEKGTGLGLVLCSDFVKKHNGQIDVESEIGKGSVFRIILPVNEGKQ